MAKEFGQPAYPFYRPGEWSLAGECELPTWTGHIESQHRVSESDLTSLSLDLLSVKCGKGYNPGPAEVCGLNAIS